MANRKINRADHLEDALKDAVDLLLNGIHAIWKVDIQTQMANEGGAHGRIARTFFTF